MRLPDDAVGISDLIAHQECARRMSYSMRRHTARGTQSDRHIPEADSPATAYGSAIHGCIAAVEAGESDGHAIAEAFKRWGAVLAPADRDRLAADLDIYRARDFPGTRTLASEDEFRVPLTRHNGRLIYFRFRLDRLYERVDAPGTYIHVDYKSSAHPKTSKQVDSDLQMWAYNWGIHEFFPECQDLSQFYDQLRFGQTPTRKTTAQRQQIKDWLVDAAIALLDDDDVQEDGLLPYRYNQWCAWCPIMESCGVVADLTDFALARIAALAPERSEGRRTVLELASSRVEDYVAQLDKVQGARAVLKRFDESVREMIKQMPDERRADLGYAIFERGATVFDAEAVQNLHDALGDRFYRLVHITKTGLQAELGDDDAMLRWALAQGTPIVGTQVLAPAHKDAA